MHSFYNPYNYEVCNLIDSSNLPSTVHNYDNATFAYWQRSLYQRLCSVFDIEVPEEWEGNIKDHLYALLFAHGNITIFNSNKYGLVFDHGNLYGLDFFYQPTNSLIANPALEKSLDLKIGVDCEVLKFSPDYAGAFDIINRYAEQLALIDSATNMSLINSKLAYLLIAKNKASAQALKAVMDLINRGEPTVVVDKSVFDDSVGNEPFHFIERTAMKQNYITSELLQDAQSILNAFDAEIGIVTMPYQKAERLVSAEANMRTIDSKARAKVWLECMESSIKRIKKLYPNIRLSVKMAYNEEEEVNTNVSENDFDRNE